MNRSRPAFTLVEVMVVLTIIALLYLGGLSLYRFGMQKAGIKVSSDNLHQLAVANIGYANDHGGWFCPAQDERNLTRWHGGRESVDDEFKPERGYLAPYFANDKRIETCPLLKKVLKDGHSFEDGAGGYGYNQWFVGGQPGNPFQPIGLLGLSAPGRTIMFATTAFAREEGLQEYPFVEPFYAPASDGSRLYDLQPSMHFRAGGRAIVAWCDGHITLEKPNKFKDTNYYGGSNEKYEIGWFGPEEENGWWNPRSPAAEHGNPD